MKNIIGMLSFCGFLLGCGASANPEVDADPKAPIQCLGFLSPSLKLSVYDSVTNNIVSTARVKLHYKDIAAGQELAFNAEALLYSGHLDPSAAAPHELSIVATEENYHSAVVKHVPYNYVTECGEPNVTEYKIYLCPLHSGCL